MVNPLGLGFELTTYVQREFLGLSHWWTSSTSSDGTTLNGDEVGSCPASQTVSPCTGKTKTDGPRWNWFLFPHDGPQNVHRSGFHVQSGLKPWVFSPICVGIPIAKSIQTTTMFLWWRHHFFSGAIFGRELSAFEIVEVHKSGTLTHVWMGLASEVN